jgi:predicted transcriptional regulator
MGQLPVRLENKLRGYQPSRCLLTAIELDILTAVGNGANAEQIGARVNANVRAAGMLLDALVALGLLRKSDDEYKNIPDSAPFFVQGSKDNRRHGLLHLANIWRRWSTVTHAGRRGRRVAVNCEDTPEWTQNFIDGIDLNAKNRTSLAVKILGTTRTRRILDLGGGSGAYCIEFAEAWPEVQCEILDRSEVVPITAEYLRKADVQTQVIVRAAEMWRDDFGSGYDLIMCNQVCHSFSEEQNRDIFTAPTRH